MMGLGFRRRIKIAPGLHINVSKSGMSASIGEKGVTLNSRGRMTMSIPGTGIRYTTSTKAATDTGQNNEPASMTQPIQVKNEMVAVFYDAAQKRMNDAIVKYYLSYGVCVAATDVRQIADEEPHKSVFEKLTPSFQMFTTITKLFQDTGSILAYDKKKLMLSIYKVEETLERQSGNIALFEALMEVQKANVEDASSKKLIMTEVFIVLLVIGCFLSINSNGNIVFGILSVFMVCFLEIRRRGKKMLNKQNKAEANKKFDSVVVREITPRLMMPKLINYKNP